VVGLQPQRDRVPLGYGRRDAWNGLLVLGPITRTVRDAGLFLDATVKSDVRYADSLCEHPGRLTIAVSYEPPPRSFAPLSDGCRKAVQRTAELLNDLGHRVVDTQLDYGPVMQNVAVRCACGVAQDAAAVGDGVELERRTRNLARLGRSIPRGSLRRERTRELEIARRINAVFETADVVLCPMNGGPPPRLDRIARRGTLRSLLASNVTAWAAQWNCIGQPAVSVPAGLDSSGSPVAIQLCGRKDDELSLLRLAAQLEQVRPWASLRPPYHVFAGFKEFLGDCRIGPGWLCAPAV
jgi:amidase